MSVNKVFVTGNLTRDPEIKSTSTGTVVVSLGLAVNDRRKGMTGEWEDYANFFNCTMFGTRAEKVSKYLHKGSKIAIDGKLHYRSWSDQQGNKRSAVEILVDNLEFMSKDQQGAQQAPPQAAVPYVAPPQAAVAPAAAQAPVAAPAVAQQAYVAPPQAQSAVATQQVQQAQVAQQQPQQQLPLQVAPPQTQVAQAQTQQATTQAAVQTTQQPQQQAQVYTPDYADEDIPF